MPTQALDVERTLDQSRWNPFALGLMAMCGLCLVIDGFDAQAMGYVAPAVIAEWQVAPSELGPVFGAGLLGMLFGALVLSVCADRLGRRPTLIASTLLFGLCMLATPHAATIGQLVAIRLVTGFFLGGVMPNAMSLIGEFSPGPAKVSRMMLASCGFTVGAALGGVISAVVIPTLGWRAVFDIGGVLPVVLAVVMLWRLPESVQFLVIRRGAGRGTFAAARQARRLLERAVPGLRVAPDQPLVVREPESRHAPVRELFREGRSAMTLLLWIVSFMNLINLYFLSNWLPTLAHAAGHAPSVAVLVGTLLQIGGVIGTLLLGRLIGRFGFVATLLPTFVVAAAAVALTGQAGAALPLLAALVFAAGFTVVGGQPAVNSLAAHYYPTALRATGIGWSLGIGRIGSVIGPVVAGQLLAWQWSGGALFLAASVPVICSAVAMALIGLQLRRERFASLAAAGA